MPIDPSIVLQVKPFELPDTLAKYAQMQQIQGTQKQNRLSDLMYETKQRESADADRAMQRENLLRQATRDALNPETGTLDPAKYRLSLGELGDYGGLQAFEKDEAAKVKAGHENTKAQREADKAQLEAKLKKFEVAAQIMGPVKDQATWDLARQQTAEFFGPEAVQQMPEQYNPVLIEQKRKQAMPIKEQLENEWKQKGYDLQLDQFGEVKRHNKVAESNAAGNLRVAQQRESREGTAPRGQVVHTDEGVMLVDPRSGTAKPVTANGEALQPKLKSLPASVQKGIGENSAALRKVESALAELDKYPEAFGVKNYLGDTVRQRTDPNGIRARALTADIGSLKIHDRSGAAVTAAETPRLKPFIPAVTDDPATVRQKLVLFQEEYKAMQDDLVSMYSRDQGYRAPTTAKPAAAASKPSLGEIFGE